MALKKINILYYPHSWNESFQHKDVMRFPKERFGNFKLIRKKYEIFRLLFLGIDSVIVFHFSLRNLPVYFLKRFKGYKIIVKSDLNYTRTNDIKDSSGFRRILFDYILKKSDEMIIETRWELDYFINQLKYKDVEKLICLHNKVYLKSEYDELSQISNEKKNIIVYYMRYNHHDPNYNFNYGLDIFLKSITLNMSFYVQKEIHIIGNSPLWLQKFMIEKFPSIGFVFLGSLNRKETYQLLKRAKYYINTSRNESFGLLLIEAAICGCNILSTFSGVARDLNLDFINEECPIIKINKLEIDTIKYVYNFN